MKSSDETPIAQRTSTRKGQKAPPYQTHIYRASLGHARAAAKHCNIPLKVNRSVFGSDMCLLTIPAELGECWAGEFYKLACPRILKRKTK